MLNIYAYYCTLLNPNSLKTFPQNIVGHRKSTLMKQNFKLNQVASKLTNYT